MITLRTISTFYQWRDLALRAIAHAVESVVWIPNMIEGNNAEFNTSDGYHVILYVNDSRTKASLWVFRYSSPARFYITFN